MLFGKKAMTNLDSVLKSRDIIMLTKVRIVMAMVFPVVTFVSWAVKKAEGQRSEAFELVLEKTPESPSDFREIKPVNLKGDQP